MNPSRSKLTLVEHLEELRRRIVIGLFAIGVSTILCFIFAEKLLSFLVRPAGKLVFITPTEVFLSYLKVSFLGGIFLSLPIVLFEIWQFVNSGLKNTEKKYILIYGPLSLLLFLIGAVFAYFVVLPLGFRFLIGFAPENIQPMISVASYVSFATVLILAFGAVFEVPLITIFLTKLGVVTPEYLSRHRKYIILLIFIVAAILTPPDVVTQVLLAIPLIFLFEFSLLLSRFVGVRK